MTQSTQTKFVPGLYSVLKLDENASISDIKSSYRKLALQFHPDRLNSTLSPDNGQTQFAEISNAYQILSDPAMRESYDQWSCLDKSALKPHFTIDLDEMTAGPCDDHPLFWTYLCRCGGAFHVEIADLEDGISIYQCSGCTLRCQVIFYLVSDDEYVAE